MFHILKPYIKRIFHLPVYRVDVINIALHNWIGMHDFGICYALKTAMRMFGISNDNKSVFDYFPLVTRSNAEPFGADNTKPMPMYWWPSGHWHTGRMEFLKWMKEQYKTDKTDLRMINQLQII